MGNSIVRVPKDNKTDYDYIAFSFNGKHSYEDFGIYRVSDGSRYNTELNPQIADRTAEVAGSDGMIYFGSNYKQKVFNVSFAFDGLTDIKIRELRRWLSGKDVHDLWFAEEPYKIYSAKVTGQPSIKVMPFDDATHGRVYKGEGTVQFTAYWPYAHTPDKIQKWDGTNWVDVGSGMTHTSYTLFQNYNSIKTNLPGYGNSSESYGDLPFHFVAKLQAPESAIDVNIAVAAIGDEIGAAYSITAPKENAHDGQEYIIGG